MAQYEDLTIDQGSDVAVEIHLVDKNGAAKNLNYHTITATMKKTYNSDSDDTTSFTSIVASPATRGIVTLSLTHLQTELLKPGRYVYDVEMSYLDSDSDMIVERILEGQVVVTPSVTR